MPQFGYKLPEFVNTLINCVDQGCMDKNEDYVYHEVLNFLGNTITRNTLDSYLRVRRSQLNAELRRRRPGWKVRRVMVQKLEAGVRVEGCNFGPFGVVTWPIRPKFRNWFFNRPKLLEWVLSRPSLLG